MFNNIIKQLSPVYIAVIFIMLIVVRVSIGTVSNSDFLYFYYERLTTIPLALLMIVIPIVSIRTKTMLFEMQAIKNVYTVTRLKYVFLLLLVIVLFIPVLLIDYSSISSRPELYLSFYLNLVFYSLLIFNSNQIFKNVFVGIILLLVINFACSDIMYPLYNNVVFTTLPRIIGILIMFVIFLNISKIRKV